MDGHLLTEAHFPADQEESNTRSHFAISNTGAWIRSPPFAAASAMLAPNLPDCKVRVALPHHLAQSISLLPSPSQLVSSTVHSPIHCPLKQPLSSIRCTRTCTRRAGAACPSSAPLPPLLEVTSFSHFFSRFGAFLPIERGQRERENARRDPFTYGPFLLGRKSSRITVWPPTCLASILK